MEKLADMDTKKLLRYIVENFPETWENRPGGLKDVLAEKLLDEPDGIQCPQCGSRDNSKTLAEFSHEKDGNHINCRNCSWAGTSQDWIDIEALKKRIKNEAD